MCHTNSAQNGSTDQKRFLTKFIRIPRESVGLILGQHGRTIRNIEFETKTFLKIQNCEMDEIRQSRLVDNCNSWSITNEENWDVPIDKKCNQPAFAFLRIQAHSEDQIRLVRLALNGILSEGRRYKRTEIIKVPKASVGYIIGKDGSNIKRINRICGVKVQVDQSGTEWEKITITGSDEGVENAKSRIDAAVARSYRIREMKDINNNQLIGQYKHGENLQKDVEELLELRNGLEKPEYDW